MGKKAFDATVESINNTETFLKITYETIILTLAKSNDSRYTTEYKRLIRKGFEKVSELRKLQSHLEDELTENSLSSPQEAFAKYKNLVSNVLSNSLTRAKMILAEFNIENPNIKPSLLAEITDTVTDLLSEEKPHVDLLLIYFGSIENLSICFEDKAKYLCSLGQDDSPNGKAHTTISENLHTLKGIATKLLFIKFSGIYDDLLAAYSQETAAKIIGYITGEKAGSIVGLLGKLTYNENASPKNNPYTLPAVEKAILALTDAGINAQSLQNIYNKMKNKLNN